MKIITKIIFLLFLLPVIPLGAQNIGIGVSNPLQKLHVGGKIRVDSLQGAGEGILKVDTNGDLLRLNFTGNASDVLRGNGSFGPAASDGLPSGAIVGSKSSNDLNLLNGGFSFFGELTTPFASYHPYPSSISDVNTMLPTYETGDPNKVQAPSARAQHSAVWTGSEMIVFGGWGFDPGTGIYFLNDGSRYNPSTDSWNPIPVINGPTKRAYHSSVWTGTEAIVWGGVDSLNLSTGWVNVLNNGKKFNPATNSWSLTSLALAPSPRAYHSTAWTGTYMVIWGGTNFGAWLSNGGRYNPSTNTWSTMSTLNAPLADGIDGRIFWTGSQIVVLGYQDSIGRYNPNTNVWSISARCPAGDYYNKKATAWTGSELWVYYDKKMYKYNPGTNIWTTTTISGLTFPPYNTQEAIWSDSHLYIFSNEYDDNGNFTGNRMYVYNPVTNSFTYTSIYGEAVSNEASYLKAGNMIIRWGGYAILANYDGVNYRFSRRGERIYLVSGLSIPGGYAASTDNNKLYLYRKD